MPSEIAVGAGKRTTGLIAEAIGATLIGSGDVPISRISSLEEACPGDITFIRSRHFAHSWGASKAAAAVISRGVDMPSSGAGNRPLLIVDDADVAMSQLLRLFAQPTSNYSPGVHPSSVVDLSATLGQGVHVGPHCVIGPDVVIGDGTIIIGNASIGRGVEIGAICTIYPGVRILDRTIIGSSCIIQPNVTIGADGFGYHPSPDGRGLVKVPHIGIVRIGDAVEIGANSCVDRAKFGETRIGSGTKIDNLVQIGHNCHIGRSVVICGCCGIAGSVTIGDGAMIGGAVGVSDGLKVGAGAKIAARAAVLNDVPDGATYAWQPAWPAQEALRAVASIRKLPDMMKRFKALEKELERFRAGIGNEPEGADKP